MKTTLRFLRPALLAGSLLSLFSTFAEASPEAKATRWQAVTVAQGISHPWGMTWLPNGDLLVTSRNGSLHILRGDHFENVPMEGMPQLLVFGHGGLLDIAAHPGDRGRRIRLYMTMALGTLERNRTALVRGVYDGQRVGNFEVLFRASPVKAQGEGFGSRLLWLPDGTLLITVGDGGNPPLVIGDRLARDQAQNLESHWGKVLRLTEDGKPAPGNPFLGQSDAASQIWTYGHREQQGLALGPEGRVWLSEHGPMGGDEINRLVPGRNYGWPLQSYGFDYRNGEPVGDPVVPGVKRPATHWTPSIAPSGLAVYSGDDFPRWRGNLFAGGLVSRDIRRLVLNQKGKVIRQTSLSIGERVRDVRQGPDGKLYVLTDEGNGKLLRIDRL